MNPITDGKPVEGFPAYRVTPDGQVWTCWKRANTLGNGHGYVMGDTWKTMKFGRNQMGHKVVGLNNGDGKGQKRKWVHVIVLEAFVCRRPNGMQCRHKDGNPANNHVSNLMWGTAKENQSDRKVHGTSMEGEKHPMARLTQEQVLQIRELYGEGARYGGDFTQVELARLFGIKQGHITKVIRGLAWKPQSQGG